MLMKIEKINLKKELERRHFLASDMAKMLDISPAHMYSIIKDYSKAGPELKKKIDHILSYCHSCHRPWPKKQNGE